MCKRRMRMLETHSRTRAHNTLVLVGVDEGDG